MPRNPSPSQSDLAHCYTVLYELFEHILETTYFDKTAQRHFSFTITTVLEWRKRAQRQTDPRQARLLAPTDLQATPDRP